MVSVSLLTSSSSSSKRRELSSTSTMGEYSLDDVLLYIEDDCEPHMRQIPLVFTLCIDSDSNNIRNPKFPKSDDQRESFTRIRRIRAEYEDEQNGEKLTD